MFSNSQKTDPVKVHDENPEAVKIAKLEKEIESKEQNLEKLELERKKHLIELKKIRVLKLFFRKNFLETLFLVRGKTLAIFSVPKNKCVGKHFI